MKIYHEQQESALCGQHCLNNLLQGPVFTAPDLSDIALALDSQESSIASGERKNNISYNVDESGNFSIEVLRSALQMYSIQLISWSSSDEVTTDPEKEEIGFVINRQEHWFAIRKINGRWWNLNSTIETPEVISNFYLAAFLSQLRNDKCYVFIARGILPAISTDTGGVGRWYEESELLGTGKNSAPEVRPFSGVGRKLGTSHSSESPPSFEDDIALAIAMSMEKPVPILNAKEEMRAKRLAAIAQRSSEPH